MKNRAAAPPIPSLSPAEFEAARLEMLKRRFLGFTTAVGILLVLLAIPPLLVRYLGQGESLRRIELMTLLLNGVAGAAFIIIPRLRRRFERWSLSRIVRQTVLVVIVAATTQLVGATIIAGWLTDLARRFGWIDETGSIGSLFPMYAMLMIIHTAASLVVPWRVSEAVRPLIVLALFQIVGTMGSTDSWQFMTLGFVGLLLGGMPGLLISWLRYSELRNRFALRMLSGRYAEMQRELAYARRIHERLFPAPITDGPLRVSFSYEPMREIGGDYFDLQRGPDGILTLVLVDVTGHGIAAALAVNRLHGEIKRIVAERVNAGPTEVITALNRYIYHTLADEKIFATALALRIDPRRDVLEICNAGHPPALILAPGAALRVVEDSAAMLGMLDPSAFEAETIAAPFGSGARLFCYTDGVLECHDATGQQFGQERLNALASAMPPRGNATAAILQAVAAHRGALAVEDDTLILAIERA